MFDYLIIGAGSAGCVLAHRLSEDPSVRVLLLEAGPADKARDIHVPAAFSRLFKTEYDWAYHSEPQQQVNRRRMFLPRGRVLGGSSSINAMIYIRGNRLDYDHWAALGNRGWGYDDLLPYFKKSERQGQLRDSFHGLDGLLSVNDLRDPHPVTQAFVDAAEEMGFARNPDFNGAQQEGFGQYQVNQEKGKRHSAAAAFLTPILDRPNLEVRTGVQVRRILLEGKRAVGVEYQLPTHIQEVRARREVILAAGAYNSPQLLMLSGIGDPAELTKHNIEQKHALPGVGQHLQDHLIVPLSFRSQSKKTLDVAEKWPAMVDYLVWGEGPLSSNVAEAGGFVHTRDGLEGPDVQYHFAPGFFMNHGFDRPEGYGFSFGPTLLQPGSKGAVRLQSADPLAAPRIDHQYFTDPEDLETLVRGFRLAMDFANTEALGRYLRSYYLPNKRLSQADEIRRHIREHVQTLYHPTGTCRMGDDDLAVVDDQLRVHGLQGLRVVDASAMPQIVRGNTHAPTVALAEKAADLIKQGLDAYAHPSIKVKEKLSEN